MNGSPESDPHRRPAADAPASASLGSALKAIAWGFLGIRKSSGQQQDMARVKPLQLIVVALLVVIALVMGLIALVHWIAPH